MSEQASVSDCIGAAGSLPVVRWRGREYKVGRPDPKVFSAIEQVIIRSAADGVQEAKGGRSAAEHAADVDALQAAIRSRQYRPGGSLWDDEMGRNNGYRGFVLMLWGCMAAANDPPPSVGDVSLMHDECEAEVTTAAAVVMPDFTQAAGERGEKPAAQVRAEVAAAKARAAAALAKV